MAALSFVAAIEGSESGYHGKDAVHIVLAKKRRAPLELGGEGVHINNRGNNSKGSITINFGIPGKTGLFPEGRHNELVIQLRKKKNTIKKPCTPCKKRLLRCIPHVKHLFSPGHVNTNRPMTVSVIFRGNLRFITAACAVTGKF